MTIFHVSCGKCGVAFVQDGNKRVHPFSESGCRQAGMTVTYTELHATRAVVTAPCDPKVGDRVRVINSNSSFWNECGTVEDVGPEEWRTCAVKLKQDRTTVKFLTRELELVNTTPAQGNAKWPDCIRNEGKCYRNPMCKNECADASPRVE